MDRRCIAPDECIDRINIRNLRFNESTERGVSYNEKSYRDTYRCLDSRNLDDRNW